MRSRTLLSAILHLVAMQIAAQERDTDRLTSASAPSAPRATSVVIGGFAIENSRLALLKLEHARGRWALAGDLSRDGVKERWALSATQAASRGDYAMWATSASLRRYTRDAGRGFFAELGGGVARARLDVVEDRGRHARRRATVPLAGWGVGGRLDLWRSGTFAELGLRSAIPLATRHLYTTPEVPAGSDREPVTYQSWYFGRGKPTSQLYVGIGVGL